MIPLVDLRAQYREIGSELEEAVRAVLPTGGYILGPEVAAFEQEFAAHVGAAHGVGVNSGTSALHLALLAAGVGPGDEVITAPFTFVATVAAIRYAGARPVFVDVDPVSYTLDPAGIERALTPRTKAIIPVHLYGQPADLDPILATAREHHLTVIEDAAQAHGAEYRGQRVGALGDSGCFSFYPGKNLGACGEGGIVVTNDADTARAVRMMRDWGQERKYEHSLPGFNYRMDALQGALLRVKLRHLEAWTLARRAHAARYDELLRDLPLELPTAMPDRRHVYHIYAIRTPARTALQAALAERDIHSGIHYPIPVHLQPVFSDLGGKPGDFPVSERIAAEVLSLPMFPELTQEQLVAIADAVTHWAGAQRPVH